MMLKKLALLAIAGAGVLTAQAANAQATTEMTVKLTVREGCTFQLGGDHGSITPSLNFGTVSTYGTGSSSAPDDNATATLGSGDVADGGTMVVLCSPGTTFTPKVTIDGGANAVGGARAMVDTVDGTTRVPYSLYSDAAHLVPWEASTAQTLALDGTGKAAVRIEGVVGDVSGVPAGDYIDTVTVTMTL